MKLEAQVHEWTPDQRALVFPTAYGNVLRYPCVKHHLKLAPETSSESPPTRVTSLYGFSGTASAPLPWSAPSLGLSRPALSFSRSR